LGLLGRRRHLVQRLAPEMTHEAVFGRASLIATPYRSSTTSTPPPLLASHVERPAPGSSARKEARGHAALASAGDQVGDKAIWIQANASLQSSSYPPHWNCHALELRCSIASECHSSERSQYSVLLVLSTSRYCRTLCGPIDIADQLAEIIPSTSLLVQEVTGTHIFG
jgi:hypothetical protein